MVKSPPGSAEADTSVLQRLLQERLPSVSLTRLEKHLGRPSGSLKVGLPRTEGAGAKEKRKRVRPTLSLPQRVNAVFVTGAAVQTAKEACTEAAAAADSSVQVVDVVAGGSDEEVVNRVSEALSHAGSKTVLLNGFPSSIEQVSSLASIDTVQCDHTSHPSSLSHRFLCSSATLENTGWQ